MFRLLKKCIVFLVVFSLMVVNIPIFGIVTYAEVSIAYIKGTGVNVRAGSSTSYQVLGQVSSGDRVVVKGTTKNGTMTWYQIDYNGKVGYVCSDYIYFPKQYVYDENFEAQLVRQNFPEDYKEYLRLLHAEYPMWTFEAFNTGLDFESAVSMEDEGTRSLVTVGAISSYKSTEDGKFDWTTSTWPTFDGKAWVCASKDVIKYYMDPRNFLVEPYVFQFEKQTFDSSVHTLDGVKEMVKGTFLDSTIKTTGAADKLIGTNDSSYLPNAIVVPNGPSATQYNGPIAKEDITMPSATPNANVFYDRPLTPIDYTDENGNVIPILKNIDADTMINFASTIYAPGVTQGSVVSPIIGIEDNYEEKSYFFNYLPAGDHSYAEIIFDACMQVGINPYVVVAMILQEQGKDGKSDLISGKKANYLNLYNYGSVGAYVADGRTAIENGLLYASTEGSYNRPWNTKEKALYGVIDYYAHSFIKRGQDTFYLKKWNVQGNNAFKHQYMTNVLGAASEGQILSSAYDDNLKHMKHVMKIPIYNNLPVMRCEKPTKDGNPNNKLKDLTVSGYTLTPTFNKDTYNYTLIVPENTKKIKVNATKYHSKASISGVGDIALNTAITNVIVRVVAENGDIREYTVMVYTPGAVNNMAIVNQIEQQEAPLIVPNVNNVQNNTYNSGNFVPAPPMSNMGLGEQADIIYGVLN